MSTFFSFNLLYIGCLTTVSSYISIDYFFLKYEERGQFDTFSQK